MKRLALVFAGLLGSARPAAACEVAIAFALDVSASVDAREYDLQMDGLATALGDPAVQAAILAQPGGVAFAAYEWSGKRQQTPVAPWTRVASLEAIRAFARVIASHARVNYEFPTAIGYALGHGAVLMRTAPPCQRQVIDVSGDGVGNDGFPPDAAYRAFAGDFGRITVNGLAVEGSDPFVVEYYREELIWGQDAFLEVADGFEDFARAMRRKLLRELSPASVVMAE